MIKSVHLARTLTVLTIIASILFQISNTLSAPDATLNKTINLEECITIAIENNLQIATVIKKLGISEAERIKASLLMPSNPKLNSRIGNRNAPEGRHTDYMFSLSQEFQIYGQRRKKINISNKKIERVKSEIVDVERNIIANVKINFYEVLKAKEILKFRKNVESIFEKL